MVFHPREGWSSDGSRRAPALSRRSFLAGADRGRAGRRAAACGSSGSSTATTAGSTTTTQPLALPRPNAPGHLAAVRIQSGHRRRIGAGEERHTQAVQLGGLHQPEGPQRLRQEVQLQGGADHVQHHERGHRQAADRSIRFRSSSSPPSTSWASWWRASWPVPSTTPTSPTSPRPGPSTRTRSTTRAGSTRCPTRSTPPASPGGRTRWTRIPTPWPIRGRCRGTPSTRARWPSSTTTARAWPWA